MCGPHAVLVGLLPLVGAMRNGPQPPQPERTDMTLLPLVGAMRNPRVKSLAIPSPRDRFW